MFPGSEDNGTGVKSGHFGEIYYKLPFELVFDSS